MPLESIPTGEDKAIEEIRDILKRRAEWAEPTGPMGHLVHRKAHGLVDATLRIELVPEHLRFGLFANPGVYQCLIRFSNGSGQIQPDTAPDVRGIAVKVKLNDQPWCQSLGEIEDGKTEDFLMSNASTFFVRNASDYVDFTNHNSKGSPLKFFFGGFNPLRWRIHEAMSLAKSLLAPATNPLALRYWSQTPYQVGPYAVKYSLVPSGKPAPQFKPNSSPNLLRETMANHLLIQPASFDLMVQVQSLPGKMPVEDPTIEWDEQLSPFYKVGTLLLPVQQFDVDINNRLGESLSFSPGHAVHHRPIGGINRVRLVVYKALSDLRRKRNGAIK